MGHTGWKGSIWGGGKLGECWRGRKKSENFEKNITLEEKNRKKR